MENYSIAEKSIQSTPGSFGEGEINVLSIYLMIFLYISVVSVKSLLFLQHYRQIVCGVLHLHVPLTKLQCKQHWHQSPSQKVMCLIIKAAWGSQVMPEDWGDWLGLGLKTVLASFQVSPSRISYWLQGMWERRRRASLPLWMCKAAVELNTHFLALLGHVCIVVWNLSMAAGGPE